MTSGPADATKPAGGAAHLPATPDVPHAIIRRERRWTWALLVPLLAIIAAGFLGWQAWIDRGVIITLTMDDGHGLEPGAAVQHRGISVGRVRSLDLASDGKHVIATVSLEHKADLLARSGSRFWVVRPQIQLSQVSGLDTILGARYLAVIPGSGAPQRAFDALPEPPVVTEIDPGDLQVLIRAPQRSGLRRSAPVMYRQMRIGVVLSVGLTSDAGAVEARILIEKPYVELIRERTVFWPINELKFDAGLTGIELELESIDALLAGGIALATPPSSGALVITGHRFELSAGPDPDWLEWQPQVALGSSLLPAGARAPTPQQGKLIWSEGRIGALFQRERSRAGWMLYSTFGLLGPVDLLFANDGADPETVRVEVAGSLITSGSIPRKAGANLAIMETQIDERPWPTTRMRLAGDPEDCLVIGDPTAKSRPLAAARFTRDINDTWRIDEAASFDRSWHGAIVVSREDGHVIGVLIAPEDRDAPRVVALLPRELLEDDADDMSSND